MKAALLYFCLWSLVGAQSELQSHYRRVNQKCVGEHQVTVKSRHSKHGYYIFNYMYSPSVPNNQTQIKKEDDKHSSRATHSIGRNSESSGPVDKLTDSTPMTTDLTEMGNYSLERRTIENNQNLSEHLGSTRNWDFDQGSLEFFVDERGNELSNGSITSEKEGSGDNFPGQIQIHHAVTISNKYHDHGKNHQITRGSDGLPGKEKAVQSGISNNTKSSKVGYIKNGVKENDTRLTKEIKLYLLKKTEDPEKKEYSKISLKGSVDATSKKPDKNKSDYINLLPESKKNRETSKLQTYLDRQSNLSRNVLEKIEPTRPRNNYTNALNTSGVKIHNKNSISNTTLLSKDGGEYIGIVRKFDGPKYTLEISRSREKVEENSDIIGGSYVEETSAIKEGKKDGASEDVSKGQAKNYLEAAVISRTHREDDGKFDGRPINQGTIKPKTNKSTKGVITFLRRISGHERSGPNTKVQGRKGTLGVVITNQESNNGKEDVLQKGLGIHDKINRKDRESLLEDPELQKEDQSRFGVTFQDINNNVVKTNISSNIATGMVAELKKINSVDPSITETEYHNENAIKFKNALSSSHGSHRKIQHVFNIPTNENLKAQEHSLSTVKEEKALKPSKMLAKVNTQRSHTAKQHPGYSSLRKKSSQHNKKRQTVKKVHQSDSSQSSESEEISQITSRQSYESYQNDNADSYRSVESIESYLSAEKNQSDDHSEMESSEPDSQENSLEHKSSN